MHSCARQTAASNKARYLEALEEHEHNAKQATQGVERLRHEASSQDLTAKLARNTPVSDGRL